MPSGRVSATRIAAPVFLASCACIFLFFWLGSVFVSTPQADIVPLRLPTWDEAKWWLGRPDTGFYIDIAENGYKAAPWSSAVGTNWAFFPAYPLILRLLAHGRSPEFYLVTGFALSLAFYALGVWYLVSLLLNDYDGETVTRAVILFCFYPFAFSLAVFGPDALLLLTVCAAFHSARQNRWIIAGFAAGIACVTRVQGVLVVPCLMYLYLKKRNFDWKQTDRNFLPLLLSPIGLLAFSWHLGRLTGNPLAFIGIQRAWNNAPSYPFAFLVNFLHAPALIDNSGWNPAFLTVIVTCAMTPLAIWAWKKQLMPIEYCLFFALQLIVLTCRTSTMGNLRYVTGCFPFFLALGILTKRTATYSMLLAMFAAFFGLFAALFAAGQQHHPGYHFAAF
jgi:Gpi18-like mannosyltransferase